MGYVKDSSGAISSTSGRITGVGSHIFPKVISPNVNVIERLKFELTNYDITVQDISHYAMPTPRWYFKVYDIAGRVA